MCFCEIQAELMNQMLMTKMKTERSSPRTFKITKTTENRKFDRDTSSDFRHQIRADKRSQKHDEETRLRRKCGRADLTVTKRIYMPATKPQDKTDREMIFY